ncbi:nucleoside 2-deoxyribosyltransferase [Candidatus Microgenomates bacterium]|nr:nucleoside 2-deoxyribosyltransferase [Candidatus Microgenomates bacterium]
MKIFISYKFRGVDKADLRKKLEQLSSILENNGDQTFIYFRDGKNWEEKNYPPKKAFRETFAAIKKCDALLAFVEHPEKSEGMLLELGYAKALDKKIILLISQNCSKPDLEALADQVIEFNCLERCE